MMRVRFVAIALVAGGVSLLGGCRARSTSAVTSSNNSIQTGIVDNSKGFSVDVCQTVGSGSATSTDGSSARSCNQGKFFIHKKGDRTKPCSISNISNWSSADLECEADS